MCVRLIQFSLPFTCCHRFSFLGKHDLEHLASCHNAHLWELCNSVTPKTVIPAGRLSACLKSWSAQPELWFFEGGNKVTFVYLFVLFLLLWYLPNPSFCELSAGYVKQDKLRQSVQSLRKTSSSLSLRKYTPWKSVPGRHKNIGIHQDLPEGVMTDLGTFRYGWTRVAAQCASLA